jgi:hypothetical protein
MQNVTACVIQQAIESRNKDRVQHHHLVLCAGPTFRREDRDLAYRSHLTTLPDYSKVKILVARIAGPG